MSLYCNDGGIRQVQIDPRKTLSHGYREGNGSERQGKLSFLNLKYTESIYFDQNHKYTAFYQYLHPVKTVLKSIYYFNNIIRQILRVLFFNVSDNFYL